MQTWPLQHPSSELTEVLDRVEQQGPQIITRAGVETAVVIPIEEWRRLHPNVVMPEDPLNNEQLLEILRSGLLLDLDIPPRGQHRHRAPLEF